MKARLLSVEALVMLTISDDDYGLTEGALRLGDAVMKEVTGRGLSAPVIQGVTYESN